MLRGTEIAAIFDPKTSSFLGGRLEDVMIALSSDKGAASARSALLDAMLTALSSLDQAVVARLGLSSAKKQQDNVNRVRHSHGNSEDADPNNCAIRNFEALINGQEHLPSIPPVCRGMIEDQEDHQLGLQAYLSQDKEATPPPPLPRPLTERGPIMRGIVSGIEDCGAFVSLFSLIGPGRRPPRGFLHVSHMGVQINHPGDMVTIDMEVWVELVEVNGNQYQQRREEKDFIQLSMNGINQKTGKLRKGWICTQSITNNDPDDESSNSNDPVDQFSKEGWISTNEHVFSSGTVTLENDSGCGGGVDNHLSLTTRLPHVHQKNDEPALCLGKQIGFGRRSSMSKSKSTPDSKNKRKRGYGRNRRNIQLDGLNSRGSSDMSSSSTLSRSLTRRRNKGNCNIKSYNKICGRQQHCHSLSSHSSSSSSFESEYKFFCRKKDKKRGKEQWPQSQRGCLEGVKTAQHKVRRSRSTVQGNEETADDGPDYDNAVDGPVLLPTSGSVGEGVLREGFELNSEEKIEKLSRELKVARAQIKSLLSNRINRTHINTTVEKVRVFFLGVGPMSYFSLLLKA